MNVFNPTRGATIQATDGRRFALNEEIGKGGEGSVWSIQADSSLVAKFYHRGLTPDKARKIEAMCRLQSEALLRISAWPIAVLGANGPSGPQGLLMPRINGYQEAHLLYTPKSRRVHFPEAQFPFILHACINIARAFATVHEAGQVIGDVNHGNLLISPKAMTALIDCDSFEINDGQTVYPCEVGVPTYTPPELQGRTLQGVRRTRQHDAFGLAVLIFHMLFLGRHPFAGIFRQGTADKTIEDAIREYRFAYSPDTRSTEMLPPPSMPTLADFNPELTKLFIRSFSMPAASGQRPSADEWITPLTDLAQSLKQCSDRESHQYYQRIVACPWCRVEKLFGRAMFGITLTFANGVAFDLTAAWARIEEARPDESEPIPHRPILIYIPVCRILASANSREGVANFAWLGFS